MQIQIHDNYDDKVILVDKPLDWTSARVVNFLKKKMNIKKAGHSGTLDPRATGLLIVCTGLKTKIISGMIEYDKGYDGVIRIGAVTNTFDTESEEENIKDVSSVTDEDILKARHSLTGEISQVPPVHSAIKQKGKPVYKLARKGREVNLEPRKVNIYKFDVKRLSSKDVWFYVLCSKGTYIRSLANDFGKKLGTGAYLKSLRRTSVGEYKIDNDFINFEGIKIKVL